MLYRSEVVPETECVASEEFTKRQGWQDNRVTIIAHIDDDDRVEVYAGGTTRMFRFSDVEDELTALE
jgi:hypothetical protein